MRNLLTSFAFVMALTLTACDKKDELPIEPPRPSTQPSPKSDLKPVNYKINPAGFDGFGPAKFGSNEESVRISWGRPLDTSKPAKGSSCYYLYPENNTASRSINFMVEDGKFVRYEVYDKQQTAPGDIKVGDSSTAIMQAYAGNVHDQPHKYLEGAHTLIVTPSEASEARLIFETDAKDQITNWRIGIPPQVYYVEGCS